MKKNTLMLSNRREILIKVFQSILFLFITWVATGQSIEFGFGSEARMSPSNALGANSITNSIYSSTLGLQTQANGYASTVIGMYNDTIIDRDYFHSPGTPLFIIGNGSGFPPNIRSNALVVLKSGRTSIYSDQMSLINGSGDADLRIDGISGNSSIEFAENGTYKGAFGWDETNDRLFVYQNGNALFAKDGKVMIGGSTSSTEKLSVNGDASKNSAGSWAANSDRRLKKNITTLSSDHMLQKVLSMRGVSYEWNDEVTGMERPIGQQYGFIAQDLQKIWPENISKDQQGFLMTAYGNYDPMFVEAIKAQQSIIEKQQDQINNQQAQIKSLIAEVNSIKNRIKTSSIMETEE